MTPRGLAALRAELTTLKDEQAPSDGDLSPIDDRRRAMEARDFRRRDLEARISSAVVIDHPPDAPNEVRFGARVHVRSVATGVERTVTIVGVDEADAATGRVTFVSPLARAVLGRRMGDTLVLRTPVGEEELEVLGVAYGDGD